VDRLAIDKSGFVWVAGKNGVFRFDGVQYLSAVSLGLPKAPDTELAATKDGTVWALQQAKLYRLNGSNFELASTNTNTITAAGELLYVIDNTASIAAWHREHGSWQLAEGGPKAISGKRLRGEASERVYFITQTHSGKAALGWAHWKNDKFESAIEALPYLDSPPEDVAVSSDTVYVESGRSVFKFRRQKTGSLVLANEFQADLPRSVRLLNGDSCSLWYRACGAWHTPYGQGVHMSATALIMEDRPGDRPGLWGARGPQGLALNGWGSIALIHHESLADRPALASVQRGNRIFYTRDDGIMLFEGTREMQFCDGSSGRSSTARTWSETTINGPLQNLAMDIDNSIWAVAKSGSVLQFSPEGKQIARIAPSSDPVSQVEFTTDGQLWGISKSAIFRIDRSQSSPQLEKLPLPPSQFTGFARDSLGSLLAVSSEALFRYVRSSWQPESWPSCLASRHISSVTFGEKDDRWISYRDHPGFTHATRHDNNWQCQHFNASNGFSEIVNFLYRDSRGRLWRSDTKGLYVSRNADHQSTDWAHISKNLGLESEGTHSWIKEDSDGIILTARGNEIYRLRPRFLESIPAQPPQLSYIDEGGRPSLQATNLTSGQNSMVTIHLSALPEKDFASPALLEYRFDSGDWTTIYGHSITLNKAPIPSSRIEIRYTGGSAILAFPISVHALWWQGRWAQTAVLSAPIAVFIAMISFFVRGFERWRYRISKKRFLAKYPQPEVDTWADLHPATVLRGRYRLEGLLARGGFSDVYKAIDTSDGSPVVVKRLRRGDMSPAQLHSRFNQEVTAVSMIQHEGILPIIETWMDNDGLPHLVMPFIDGPTLRQRLAGTPMAQQEALELLREIASILSAAHEGKLVHSDLKPENIMLTKDRAVLIDFGAAALHIKSSLSSNARPAGSLLYMAPEQLLGAYSLATDVYSFALIAFEVLAWRPYGDFNLPFDSNWEDSLRTLMLEELRWNQATLSVFLDGLRFNPDLREKNVSAWLARLEAALS